MGTNRFSALYRFRALFGGDGKKRYIGTLLYLAFFTRAFPFDRRHND